MTFKCVKNSVFFSQINAIDKYISTIELGNDRAVAVATHEVIDEE